MPTNLELKVKLDSFDEIIKILNDINAKFEQKLVQKDIYFFSEKGLLKLRKEKNRQQLIRYKRNEKSRNRWSDYEFIFIDDRNAEKYLKNILDYEVTVEKKRLLYMFENTRIHLDDVQNLGKFLELETLVISNKADAKKRFDFLVKKLNLKKFPSIRYSYRDLLIQKKKMKK